MANPTIRLGVYKRCPACHSTFYVPPSKTRMVHCNVVCREKEKVIKTFVDSREREQKKHSVIIKGIAY
jgi:hypothetical protein